MNRILIAGAGAMGTIIGALLSQSLTNYQSLIFKNGLSNNLSKNSSNNLTNKKHQVDLLDTNTDHINALNDKGAKIIGYLDATIKVNAINPDKLAGHYDLVISTVKQTALKTSLKQLLPFLHERSLVLTLQNGIPEDIAAEIVGKHRIIGGGMEFSGTFIEPGIVKLASPQDTLGFTIGEISDEISRKNSECLVKVQKILETIASCEITSQLREARFTKLTDNTVASAIPTALSCSLGKVFNDDQAIICVAELGRECSLVMQALDIKPLKLFGFQPTPENIAFNNKHERDQVIEYWRKSYSRYHQQTASMLQDIQQGRLCEVDFINGKMLQEAERLGIEMPMNRAVINAIKTLQAGELALDEGWEQLETLKKHCSFV